MDTPDSLKGFIAKIREHIGNGNRELEIIARKPRLGCRVKVIHGSSNGVTGIVFWMGNGRIGIKRTISPFTPWLTPTVFVNDYECEAIIS